MKQLTKIFLTISIATLFLGAVLLGAGFATGGIQAIQEITAPSKNTETFTDISDIKLDAYRQVQVQSGNVDKASVTYFSGSKFIEDIKLDKKDTSLSISGLQQKKVIAGGIEIFGYLLNEGQSSNRFNEIIITLPKDRVLNSISGSDLPGLTVSNLTVKNLTYNSYSEIKNSIIESGELLGNASVYDSTLKNLTIENYYDYSSISGSKLENLTIIDRGGGFEISNSNIKNINYSSGQTLEEIQEEAENINSDNSYNYYGSYLSLNLQNVELVGNNSFMGSVMNIDIDLSNDSKTNTSISVETLEEDIYLGDSLKALEKIKEDKVTKISHTAKDSKGKLIIKNNRGKISIK